MNDIGQGVGQPLISPTFQPLFTNKLIGLKRVQRNRITQVNLVDYSWERDEEGDILSENSHSQNEDNQENESNTSHSQGTSSSLESPDGRNDDDDNRGNKEVQSSYPKSQSPLMNSKKRRI